MPPEPNKPTEPPTKRPADNASEAASQMAVDSKAPAEKNSLTRFALLAALCVSILANLFGAFYFRSVADAIRLADTREIALGDYHFVAQEHEPGQVTRAEFCLYIELVPQAEEPARKLLDSRRHRVQQDVEELLRMAGGGDFNDPSLKGLKDQLRQQINQTLGMRAVSEVIVTDLSLQRRPLLKTDLEETVESVPWIEPPAG